MSKIHYLKIDPNQLDALRFGGKTFEIRNNDRGYEVGDILSFKFPSYRYAFKFRITHIFRCDDLKPEYKLNIKLGNETVILSLIRVKR
jgi:hypothetical protein